MNVRALGPVAVAILLMFVACSSDESTPGPDNDEVRDSGTPDAVTTRPDAADRGDGGDAAADAQPNDAGVDAEIDAGEQDTVTVILGTLYATCPELAAAFANSEASTVFDRLVFADGESYARSELSPGGQRMHDTPNAGGSSAVSEVLSYEVLHYCDGAALYKTETEVSYTAAGKRTDLVVDVAERRLGVSVTRAVPFPCGNPLQLEQATDLLDGKLSDIQQSSALVTEADRWERQILHVFTASHDDSLVVEQALAALDPAVRADTIVLVTEVDGGAFLLYNDDDAPLGTDCPL